MAWETDMRAVPSVSTVYFGAVVLLTLGLTGGLAEGQDKSQGAKPTLEEAFRKWDKGFSSDKKEERVNALRTMFPTKKDIAYLFPKYVEKLWPLFEDGHKEMVENVDLIAKEITMGGGLTKVKTIDVRTDKELASGSYKDLLEIIPKDVQVF